MLVSDACIPGIRYVCSYSVYFFVLPLHTGGGHRRKCRCFERPRSVRKMASSRKQTDIIIVYGRRWWLRASAAAVAASSVRVQFDSVDRKVRSQQAGFVDHRSRGRDSTHTQLLCFRRDYRGRYHRRASCSIRGGDMPPYFFTPDDGGEYAVLFTIFFYNLFCE